MRLGVLMLATGDVGDRLAPLERPTEQPWRDPERYFPRVDAATAALDAPLGVLSAPALAHNAFDLLDRARGTAIRVATKSVRVRAVLDAVLALPGFAGALAYTLPEALWLAESVDDVVVGYPTADRAALRALARDERAVRRVTLMVDSVEQLDLVDAVLPPERRPAVQVCLELDVSYDSSVFGRVGVWRSPVRTAEQALELARRIEARPGFELVGLMAYEAQIAGQVDLLDGDPVRSALVRALKSRSRAELAERRAAAVAEVRRVADLRFVNGGGTGSIESSVADPSVTEVAAGSGLFGPHLFDRYRAFSPAPAALFALPVVRRPAPDRVAVLGGGWIASGPSGADRAPVPVWPAGLRPVAREGFGEVQTPLVGAAAAGLGIGDRVWLRHTKAGELSEHLDSFAVVDGDRHVATVPTYRGEGRVFL